MRRTSSTVVVVAGERADEIVAGLGSLHNVRALVGERTPAELTAAIGAASATYVVHTADPLAPVREAWTAFFDQAAPHGGLEVAIESVLGGLTSGDLVLPDYYVVLNPETMPATPRHWWLGVLAGTAPARVVPADASVTAVREALAHLSAGRWWPTDLCGWLRGLPRVVPDQAGLRVPPAGDPGSRSPVS